MEKETIDFTNDKKCSNCGKCCIEFLPSTKNEYEIIKKFIKENKIEMQKHYTDTTIEITCPFRDSKNKKCLIYDVRPSVCRKYLCTLSKQQIAKNRTETQSKTFINKCTPNAKDMKIISWHRLFYEDDIWETKFWIAKADGDILLALEKMKFLGVIE